MLAAAVVGDLFASPSAASIVHAVRAVTGSSGCLFIVKNYTGSLTACLPLDKVVTGAFLSLR